MRIFVCSIYRKPHTQIVISFCRHHTSNRKHCQFACGDCVRTCLDHFANLFPQNAFQIDWLDFKWLLLIFFAYVDSLKFDWIWWESRLISQYSVEHEYHTYWVWIRTTHDLRWSFFDSRRSAVYSKLHGWF